MSGEVIKQRKSNFELLRIIAMILIIAGHFAFQSGAAYNTIGVNKTFTYMFGYASRISVNIFLMLGTWFMIDNEFNGKRVVQIYSQTWFYSVVLTAIAIFIDPSVFSIKTVIGAMLPFTRMKLWYVTIYIELMLLSPYLKKFMSTLKEIELRNLTIVLTLFVVIISTMHSFVDTFLCALTYFVYMYIFMYYYKKYLVNKIKLKRLLLIIGVLGYLCLVVVKLFCDNTDYSFGIKISSVIAQFLSDYKSLPNFVISICIFTYFIKIDIGCSKLINYVAASTLGVYIIHQVPAFHDVMWFKIFDANSWMNSQHYIINYLGVVIIVYILSIIVDKLRQKTIEPLWMNSRIVFRIQDLLNRFLK